MIEREIRHPAPVNAVAAQKLKTAVEQETAGKYESAMASLDEALSIQEKYPDAWLIKGVILTKLGKCNDALKCYDKALEINAGFTDALRLKSATYTSLGSHNKALECLSAAVELEPENLDLRLNLAGAYQRLKQFDDAFRCYQEAKRQKPSDPKIDYFIGVMWGNRADYEKALVSFEIALRSKPDFVDALLGKGLMLARLGRKEEAKAVANKLLEVKDAACTQHEKPQQKEVAMSRSENEDIRNQYMAAQKRFTSQYAPNKS
jgi:tetratricopeptide (TPR) repeat protein